ncbi:Cell invasion protein [Sodalis praecaptivus]|uniref:Cell invasion protein n=1 Tax=Sodalis praecaptivus TaxID=1239307 RepID=W0HWP6_9GAMM|nr:type III secretion system chaperone [Sodalis praecaptivus]AHF78204.1 Cell invasion protein [Sodalis praecaptivus]
MQNLLLDLYESLGLDPMDDPALLINDELEVYFDESDAGLEMCCPLRSLPTDSDQLQAILSMNYASPVTLAADADQSVLLALYRLPPESSTEDMLAGLSLYVETIEQLRQEAVMKAA